MTSINPKAGQERPLADPSKSAGMPGVLMVVVKIEPEGEGLLNRWYDEEHVADRLAVPGFRAVRRFKAADGSPRFLALWEVDDARFPMSAEYLNLPRTESAARWSERLRDILVSVTRSAWVELPVPQRTGTNGESGSIQVDRPPPGWIAQPGLFAVTMGIRPENEPDFNRWYDEEHIGDLLARPGWRSVRRFKALDDPLSLALWEVDDVRFRERPDRVALPPSAWTTRVGEYRTSVERTPWAEIPVNVVPAADGESC
jgi:hypothetical protein